MLGYSNLLMLGYVKLELITCISCQVMVPRSFFFCMSTFLYRGGGRHTGISTQTDNQADRQTDRQRPNHTDRPFDVQTIIVTDDDTDR